MGTTRIKVIDLSSEEKQIKTSRKHAEKLTGAAKIKEDKKEKPKQKEEKRTEPEKIVEKQQVPQESKEDKPTEKQEVESKTKEEKKEKVAKKTKAKESTRHKGKKYLQAKKQVENKPYKLKNALEILPRTSITKFDPAVEIHLKVSDKNVKGSVNFPHSFAVKQKKQRYLIFSEAKKETKGADVLWGNEATIGEIENGKLKAGRDFDIVIATPKFMTSLAKIAKILGPKGMMPNPKNGTITEEFEKVTSAANKRGYNFKTDPTAPIVHAKIGKLSQKQTELEENLKTLTAAIGISKIRKATLTSTMGPALKLDITSL